MNALKTYIVIGTSAAGIAAIQKIRQLDSVGRILCFSDEAEPPYNKCFLADFLGGHKELSAVYTKSSEFLRSLTVELHLGTQVTAINRSEKTIQCADGTVHAYTTLLLAVGAQARIPTILGSTTSRGFFPFYTLHDAQGVRDWIAQEQVRSVVVMGAGLTGLEVSDALYAHGARVTIVEQQPRVLMRHLDEEGAAFVAHALKHLPVDLALNTGVQEICSDTHNRVSEVVLADGKTIPADLVMGALGSSARLELAQAAGLAIEEGAVMTNEFLQTSDPSIFAAGDVALVTNRITAERTRTALWSDAVAQGMYAGAAMAGYPKPYPGVFPIAATTIFGISLHAAGFLQAQHPTWAEQVERTDHGYAKVVIDENRGVKGFICMGELVSRMVAYKRSLVTGTPLS